MLPDHSWYCAGWQLWQASGSMSALWDSVDDPGPEPQPATTATPSVTKATRGSTFMGMKYVLPRLACHNSTVSPRPLSRAAVVTLALASFGCKKSGVECMPPPVVACPDGGGPSFDADVLPIFQQVCDNCHAPDAPKRGPAGAVPHELPADLRRRRSEAHEINSQVFDELCDAAANAPVPLSDDQRQTLLVWLACGALDSPAVDAGAAD